MVFGYEVAYHLRQFVLVGELETVRDMVDDYARALHWVKHIVGVDTVLVFGKEGGIVDFAYVMIQGTCTDELYIGSDTYGCGGRQPMQGC